MSILEDMERKGNKKVRIHSVEDMKLIMKYLEDYDTTGLDGILSGIEEIKDSGLYFKLVNAFKSETYSEGWGTENYNEGKRAFREEEVNQVRSLGMARKYLHFGGLLNTIFTPSMITAKEFITIPFLIQYVYVIYAGRTTDWSDRLNIYFSRLDERLMFALNQFDSVNLEDLPEPTPEYYKSLKKLNWGSNDTKKLHNKLNEYLFEINKCIFNYPPLSERAGWMSTYRVTENFFIKTLAACNAVNTNRQKIEDQDIIRAYKTFFKLIKTDITRYKAIPELIQDIDGYEGPKISTGYLVCEKCGGYYQLEKDESPDQFSHTCECGGELIFKTSLEE